MGKDHKSAMLTLAERVSQLIIALKLIVEKRQMLGTL